MEAVTTSYSAVRTPARRFNTKMESAERAALSESDRICSVAQMTNHRRKYSKFAAMFAGAHQAC